MIASDDEDDSEEVLKIKLQLVQAKKRQKSGGVGGFIAGLASHAKEALLKE